jgi:hypothetical protein
MSLAGPARLRLYPWEFDLDWVKWDNFARGNRLQTGPEAVNLQVDRPTWTGRSDVGFRPQARGIEQRIPGWSHH